MSSKLTHRQAVTVTAQRDTRLTRVVAALIIVGAGVVLQPIIVPSRSQRALRQASLALEGRRFREAMQLAGAVLDQRPASRQALLIAGEAAAGLHHDGESLSFFQRALQVDDADVTALHGAGLRSVRLSRVFDAEQYFRRGLACDPYDVDTNRELAALLQFEGRSWESLAYIFAALREADFSLARLQELGNTEMIWRSDAAYEDECLFQDPGNRLPLIGRARTALIRAEHRRAANLLQSVTAAHPDQMQAQARLGRILIDSDTEFFAWHQGLSPEADVHPEIWFTRGLWAKRQGQPRAAARCFWETLVRYPDHVAANHQLALTLAVIGKPTEGLAFGERARKLDQVISLHGELDNGPEYFLKLGRVLESLDRRWEAAAVYRVALIKNQDQTWARDSLCRLARQLDGASRLPKWEAEVRKLDLSNEPLPSWRASATTSSVAVPAAATDVRVAFVDAAHSAGLDFQYYNGADPSKQRVFMFEYSGGGVAVLDFDLDGWPDIYLTQGCAWPLDPTQTQYRDRLFRNLGNGRFGDVTEEAGLGDNGLSHGVTVGDFNNDGYPDVYVANVGRNRFYLNEGDGTFREIDTGAACDVWSSSCVLADFNNDTLPDLYVVNYLSPKALDEQCDSEGRPVQCGPMSFAAEQDRFYVNLGDGRFRDVTQESGVTVADGKGLGVIAADFDGSHRLGLFVANDTTANFFFTNHTEQAGMKMELKETALYRGLACDDYGRSQSCMGVAAGDANGDGLLDLFVTNFTNEANAFYMQTSDGFFVDSIKRAQMLKSGFGMMGWGTQFLDGELDGLPDLVLVNGHITDYTNDGTPYKMRGQYFRNAGQGQFDEVGSDQLGEYFHKLMLGRALARLDWNRDGLEDFCATHVDDPVALLTNTTEDHGRHLTLHLRAVDSARDAIGTVVRVKTGQSTWSRQLTAGDGFYASNQRLLVFGVGANEQIDELEVDWPSGRIQKFAMLATNAEFVLIEGRDDVVRLDQGR